MERICSGWRTTSIPLTRAVPAVGISSVASILIVVVLPAPLGPMKPKMSPCSSSRHRSLTAGSGLSLYSLRRCLISIIGGIAGHSPSSFYGNATEPYDHSPQHQQGQHDITEQAIDQKQGGVGLRPGIERVDHHLHRIEPYQRAGSHQVVVI